MHERAVAKMKSLLNILWLTDKQIILPIQVLRKENFVLLVDDDAMHIRELVYKMHRHAFSHYIACGCQRIAKFGAFADNGYAF